MKQEHFEILLEEMNSKFNIVIEGHAALDQKIDRKFDQLNEKIEHNSFLIGTLNEKIDGVAADLKATDKRLSDKIDGVAADLKAYRSDTEAHHGVYRVKER